MSLVPSTPGFGLYCRKLWNTLCSTLQSITFQAIAGSRLDGSEKYERAIVPPFFGVPVDWPAMSVLLLPHPVAVTASAASASTMTRSGMTI